MYRRVAQDRDDISCIDGLRDDGRVADQLADVRRLSRQICVEHILGVDDPEHVVAVAVEHREVGMSAACDGRRHLRDRIADVDHAHFMPRRHHRADRQVAKPHHARDHFLFARLQHAGIFGLDDEGADLVFADLLFRLAPVTEQPQQRLARAIQQPYQRQ
jgi:hypothetical protein